MPIDLFAQQGIKVDQPRDLFSERGMNPMQSKNQKNLFNIDESRYTQFQQTLRETGREALPGVAQGVGNSLIGLANLLPKVNIPKVNFAPNTQAAKEGEEVGNFGSYFIPGGALKAIKPVKAALKGLEEYPKMNALTKFLGAGTEGALYGGAHANEGEKGKEALQSGVTTSGINALTQLLGIKNPLFNALIRSAIGGGAGYIAAPHIGQNPLVGMGEGASLALGAPILLNKFLSKPGLETLSHLAESEVKPALEASNRLKTPITPSEASGNPYVANIEGKYGRTGEAAAEKTKIGLERVEAQKGAIKDLLDTIVDRSTPEAEMASKKKITDLYNQANQWNLKPEIVMGIKNDPVMNEAFKRVKSDPAYQRKLSGIQENNYAYLNQVKRALQDMEGSALKAGEKDRAAEFKAAKNELLDVMDSSVPAYKAAREEAQKSIIRSNLQKAMKTKELKGSTFYNTVLKNDEAFNKLRNDLKNVPEAQAKLDDMRLAWKNLINLEKPNSAAFRSETGLNQSRNWASKLVDIWNELSGNKRNIEALKFIHSGEWDKQFMHLQSLKDQQERVKAELELIGKLLSAESVK